jgi:hypothetical protein
MKRIVLSLGVLLATASVAVAQSAPNIMKPKQAAMRAAAASNAQTAANSTLPEDTTPAKPARPEPRERHAATDSAAGSTAVTAGTSNAAAASSAATTATKSVGFERETFNYDRSGRRDPFVSLMNTSELRPYVSDLRLVAVAFDEKGRNSVAVLRDLGTKEQYRIRVGQSIGRMHVANIAPKAVVFTIEEFGYSRQETLALGDNNKGVKK